MGRGSRWRRSSSAGPDADAEDALGFGFFEEESAGALVDAGVVAGALADVAGEAVVDAGVDSVVDAATGFDWACSHAVAPASVRARVVATANQGEKRMATGVRRMQVKSTSSPGVGVY